MSMKDSWQVAERKSELTHFETRVLSSVGDSWTRFGTVLNLSPETS